MLKTSFGGKLFDLVNYLFMILLSLTILYPFVQQLNISLSTGTDIVRSGFRLFPQEITFEAYGLVLGHNMLKFAYASTLFRVIAGTLLSLLFTCLVAYPLSKKVLPHRNFWTGMIVFTMFFSGGLIPTYLIVKALGFIDSLWVYVIPSLLTPFYILIVRNFFMALPNELIESAKVDGAGEFTILSRIIVPLSKPVLATVALWLVVEHWNAWFDAMIYVNNPKKQVLQVFLRRLLMEGSQQFMSGVEQVQFQREQQFTEASIKAATLMIVTVPVLLFYPFVQKYFVKGIMIGSLKG